MKTRIFDENSSTDSEVKGNDSASKALRVFFLVEDKEANPGVIANVRNTGTKHVEKGKEKVTMSRI